MKLDTPLPTIFLDCNVCLLDVFALVEQRTGQRTVRNPRSNFLETQLSSMKERALHLRLNDELHSFVEIRGNVSYSDVVPDLFDHGTKLSDALMSSPSTQFIILKPPRMVAIRRVATKSDLTLLLIDEGTGATIAVIGTKIHWDLDGLNVRFETPNGLELRT